MQYTNEIYALLEYILFIIGVLLIPVGLAFLFIPGFVKNHSSKLNRWISTESFFNKINKPIYKEQVVYRHHHLFGSGIFIASSVCIYFLTVYKGINYIDQSLLYIAKSAFEEWLFVVCYYLLIGGLCISLILGVVIFIRPSVLKSIEKIGNKWVDTEESLKVFDRRKDLPEEVLPGNPRIFGLVVVLSAIYIIWLTNPFNL